MAATHLERELKFDVPDAFRLPDATAARPGSETSVTTLRLETTYFDTADHALLRNHLTLRRRTGDADAGWQLKVPHAAARLEVTLPPDTGGSEPPAVPEQLERLVRGAALGAPLGPSAVLRTERRAARVRIGDRVLAEIADDSVHAAATGPAARLSEWREIEIELVDGDEHDLADLGAMLREAGATPSSWPSKLARAIDLDQPAAAPPTNDPSVLVTSYLQRQVAALTAGDVSLRRGLDPVHKTRVAARRFRSILRVFAPVLSGAGTDHLDRELSWWQDLLGQVRDRQVQQQRFTRLLADLPDEQQLGPVAADLESTLSTERLTALAAVRAALDSDRYLDMLRQATAFASEPALVAGTDTDDLLALAAKARRRAAKRLATARRSEDAAALHRARKAAKRSRYATELVRPAAGKGAKRAVKRHKAVQDTLGAHQDSIVAAGYLDRLGRAAGSQADRNGFTYGLLWSREERGRQRLRKRIDRLRL